MKRLLLHVFLFLCISLHSQSYHFSNLTTDHGLQGNNVVQIIQDSRGALWIATPVGISVYDGKEFTNFTKKDGLPSNTIKCFYEDLKGNIWIGTNNGLSVYDGINFSNFNIEDNLPSKRITSICEDGYGQMWIGTVGGLCMVDNFSKEGPKIVPYKIDFNSKTEIIVTKIIETPDAKIYVGTNLGLAVINNGNVTTYSNEPGLNKAHIYDLQEDVNGDIWIATSEALVLFSNKSFKVFNKSTGFPFESVKTIKIDKNDNLWIGTTNKGVVKLNINSLKFEIFNTNKGLSEDVVNTILEDKNDNIWIGTNGGGVDKLSCISFSYFGEKEGLPNEKINSLIQDANQNFWFGTGEGLICYNGKDTFLLYSKGNGLNSNLITTVFEDKDEVIWAATSKGLAKIVNKNVEKIYHYKEGLYAIINCIFQDRQGNLWVGTNSGLGKLENDRFRFYSQFDGLLNQFVTSINQDKTGKLWIGTNGGIFWFDGTSFENITKDDSPLGSNEIKCIKRGPRGGLFIGTKSGITKFDENTNQYYTFTKENTKLASDNIKLLIFDEDNQLWAGTDKGLDRITFNPPQVARQTKQYISEIKFFGKLDGIIGPKINNNAACEDYDGNLWFGTRIGAIKHDRSVDNINDVAPKVTFTGLYLNGEIVDWKKRKLEVEAWTAMPKNLILPYDSSTVTFNYVGITHDNPEGITYYTQLIGFDDAPLKPQNKGISSYKKLPPGEYTFTVYACNKDEFCSDTNTAKFSFSVSPPFWQEPWFIILVALVIVIAIVSFIKYRERKLRAERELLEEKVKERTQEVVDKNKELELVNLEMIAINKEIEQKNNDLNSSIRYALTIQKASFPSLIELKEQLPNSFIYHLPRDIVSGDFYWYRKTNNKFVIACADCTGHGVPGALTSMIGIALLNEIVGGNKITDPAEALRLLDKGILKAFENSESETNDGMDISLITIDTEAKTIEYAGAYRPLIMIREGQLEEYKATKMSIGFKDVSDKTFEKTTISYQEGDCFYMFSDGYPDQFGGPKNKKFKTKTMKDMLVDGYAQDMEGQKEVVNQRLRDWMGETEQVDDILVMGIKF